MAGRRAEPRPRQREQVQRCDSEWAEIQAGRAPASRVRGWAVAGGGGGGGGGRPKRIGLGRRRGRGLVHQSGCCTLVAARCAGLVCRAARRQDGPGQLHNTRAQRHRSSGGGSNSNNNNRHFTPRLRTRPAYALPRDGDSAPPPRPRRGRPLWTLRLSLASERPVVRRRPAAGRASPGHWRGVGA